MRFFRNCAVGSALAYFAIALVVPSLVARFFPTYELFRQSREYLRADMEFGAVSFTEPGLVWYFRRRVHGFFLPLNNRRPPDFMGQIEPRFFILRNFLRTKPFPNPPQNVEILSSCA